MNKKEIERDCDREAQGMEVGAYLSSSVLVKDQFAVHPHVMLNVCLALSWPDKLF